MSLPAATIDRLANSAKSLHMVIEQAHKAVKVDRISRTRALLNLYYGRQIDLLYEDIEMFYERAETKIKLKRLAHVKNITRRILTESSHAYASRPVLKLRSKLAEEGADDEPAIDEMMPGEPIPLPAPPDEALDEAASAEGDQNPGVAAGEQVNPGAADADEKKVTEDPLTRIWNERVDECSEFWLRIAEAEPLSKGLGGVYLLASYREINGRMRMTWDIFTPDVVTVVQSLEAPDQPAVLALDQFIDDTDPSLLSDVNLIQRAFRIVWTKDKVLTVSASGGDELEIDWFPEKIPSGKNPYGFIPGVMFRVEAPEPGSFYGPIAESLLTANRQYNLLSTQIRNAESYQAHNILHVQGLKAEDKDELDIGPGAIVETEDQGDTKGSVAYVSSTLPLADLEQRRTNIVRDAADDYGISPRDVEADSGGIASGKALMQLSEKLIEITEKVRDRTEPQLKSLIAYSMLVWKRWNEGDPDAALIPDDLVDIEVELRFARLHRDGDPTSEDSLRRAAINDGRDTWENWYMEDHPEVESPAEARAIIMANKKSNQSLSPAAQAFGSALAAFRPGMPMQMGPDGKPLTEMPAANTPPKGVTPPGLAPFAAAAAGAPVQK